MRIRWTPAAARDLQQISDYLKDHHPQYREPTLRKMYASVQSLKERPQRGRAGREEGTRELLFPPLPYIAVYRVKEQTIEVLRTYHGAQARPKGSHQ
jgi:addiction module RelE/StbE family toxin